MYIFCWDLYNHLALQFPDGSFTLSSQAEILRYLKDPCFPLLKYLWDRWSALNTDGCSWLRKIEFLHSMKSITLPNIPLINSFY